MGLLQDISVTEQPGYGERCQFRRVPGIPVPSARNTPPAFQSALQWFRILALSGSI